MRKLETRGPWATSLTWEKVPFIKHIYAAQWSCHNIKRKSISPFRELNGWLFIKTWVPFTQNYIRQVWLKLVQWFWGRWFLEFRQCIFAYSLFSPLGKRFGPPFEQTWILHLRMCDWNVPKGSGEDFFFYFVNVFSLFRY